MALFRARNRLRFPVPMRTVPLLPPLPRFTLAVCLIAALIWVGIAATPRNRQGRRLPRAVTSRLPLSGVTVLLDPGHGGSDPGAIVRWPSLPTIPPVPARFAMAAVPARPAVPAKQAAKAANGILTAAARPAQSARPAVPAKPARPAKPGRPGTPGGRVREDALNYRFAATLACVLRDQGATVRFTVTSDALRVRLRDGSTEPALRTPGDARASVNGAPMRGAVSYLWLRGRAALPLWQVWQSRTMRVTPGRGLYFISLHHDKARGKRARGARIFSDARVGKAPIFARTLARVLASGGMAQTSRAGAVEARARELGVLNPRFNPIEQKVLLEVATLSNPRDRKNAQSARWRWQMARLVVRAIRECERPAR